MGFLIFAYRKLFLTRKINDLGFQSMLLSQKRQQITAQISNIEQSMASAKNMINIFTSTSIAYKQSQDMSKYYEYVQDPRNPNSKILKPKDGVAAENMMYTTQAANAEIMAAGNICNSVFDAISTAQLNALHAEDSQMELQSKNIESQLKLLNEEVQGVEKAESEAAKSEAPKFGLA